MDMKSNGSAYRRIKGFTLVEMIVVIAIIAILAGVMNLATQGFVKNARLETANDKAYMLFTGFQNILTQCEIKQDNSVLSAKLNASNDAIVNYDGVKQIIVEFKAYDGNIQVCSATNITNPAGGSGSAEVITSFYRSTGTQTALTYGGGALKYTDGTVKGRSALPNAIAGIIDSTFDGEAKVYIDFENYEVKSVIYKPMTDSNKNQTITSGFSDGGFDAYGTNGWYLGYDDRDAQDDVYDNSGVLYGLYPFQSNLS